MHFVVIVPPTTIRILFFPATFCTIYDSLLLCRSVHVAEPNICDCFTEFRLMRYWERSFNNKSEKDTAALLNYIKLKPY